MVILVIFLNICNRNSLFVSTIIHVKLQSPLWTPEHEWAAVFSSSQTRQWSECRIRAEWRVTVRIHHSVSGHEEQDVLRSTWRGLQRTFDVFECRGINRSQLLLWLFEAPASSHRCFHVVYLMTHRLWTPSYSSFTSQSTAADRCRNLLTWEHMWEGSLDIFTPYIKCRCV